MLNDFPVSRGDFLINFFALFTQNFTSHNNFVFKVYQLNKDL
jgi:hypothetical protein